jgi:acetolactate synthase-1/2/3 large subunit
LKGPQVSPNPVAQRGERADRAPIAADAFLRALADHGVDYFFCNPGTDFPPIVEAFARAKQTNAKVPRPMVIPHENLAVAMAHGVYLMNGRPQAVMVHVNVGTANTINNITNMSRERAPVILAAGRTPISEKGNFGARNRSIHWAQEMFDQAGMLRELVKWDYELRTPNQIADVVSRAFEVGMTSPRGPVYLVLPREPPAAPAAA